MKHQYILGLSAGFHDAATTLIRGDGEIVFAGHSERYSKKKNDANLCPELMTEFCDYEIDTIAYYERPWLKQVRNLVSGQGIYWSNVTVRQVLQNQLGAWLQHPHGQIMPLASLIPSQYGEQNMIRKVTQGIKNFGAKLIPGALGSFIVQSLSALAYTR